MIHTSFYKLVMILFSILTVKLAVEPENPCPRELEHIVADMCTNDYAEEDIQIGSDKVDSVLLRITKQEDSCICYVNLEVPNTNYTIYMSKYGGFSKSAPELPNCGLAIDVDYVHTSDSSNQPINCSSGTSKRSIALGGNELKLKSRIIGGEFKEGYCMQISRNQPIFSCKMNDQEKIAGSDDDWILTKSITFEKCKSYCLQTDVCLAVHHEDSTCFVYVNTSKLIPKDAATYSKKDCVDTQELRIQCYPPESTTQTSQETTTENTFSTKPETIRNPIGDNTVTHSNTDTTNKEDKKFKEDGNYDLYVYLGAAAGGVLMILLIVFIIFCIRKKSNQTFLKDANNGQTKQFCREDRDSDNDYGGLKDNVLYVSSEPNDILDEGNYNTVVQEQTRKVNQDNTFDGNYSTVDGICNIIGSDSSLSKSKPVIKPKPKTSFKSGSVDDTIHLSTMDNGNNEYAVVDKGRNSDAVKHLNPALGNDTEYAVVNKVKKSSNNN